jgi:hypothetical protein
LVTLDYHDTEASQEIHFVRCEQGHPNDFLISIGQVGDSGESYFGAECGEEDMLVDKEAINR